MNFIQKHSTLALLLTASMASAQFKSINEHTFITEEQRDNSTILSKLDNGHPPQSLANPYMPKQKAWQPLNLTGNTVSKVGESKLGNTTYLQTTLGSTKRSDVQGILAKFAKQLDMIDGIKDIRIDELWVDELGYEHYRLTQYRDGIEVYGSQSILHIETGNKVFLQAAFLPDSQKLESRQATINQYEAEQIVMQDLKAYHPLSSEEAKLIAGDQWQSQQVYFQTKGGEVVLAWFVQVYEHVGEHLHFFIDATDGAILFEQSTICKLHSHMPPDGAATATANDLFGNSQPINTYEVGTKYYLVDASRTMFKPSTSNMPDEPVGAIWTIDAFNTAPQNSNFNYDHVTSTNNTWGSKETAVSAHVNAGKSYEYYKNTFGREAIDGNGGNIVSIINVADENGASMGNAFWNGLAMFYGNGDSAFKPLGRGLDVAGHELTHGVVQNTANLEYQGESGALNESFADIFGAMIDRDDWLIGEDVVKTSAFPSGALRSLQDPHNGASTGDYNAGWQPRIYSERFTGSQDNGGVHINSGIPNYAFFLFASQIGKEKAEKVYYRALTTYLSRSSKFVDCRAAVVKAAGDLYDASVVNAANSAFDQVGIGSTGSTGGGNYEQDADVNLGEDFILVGNSGLTQLNLANAAAEWIVNPFIEEALYSKPSVSDDGSKIVFVGTDKRIYLAEIDWSTGSYDYDIFDNQQVWRNAIISKDGQRIAVIADQLENIIYVYDFGLNVTRQFELYNPTFTQGISTGDVLYADAMEFDITGQYIMYDANNSINSATAGEINYWDIGFVNVWNRGNNNFATGNIEKLFSALPEGVSIGNATFSKNSPYIIAFDVLEGGTFAVVGYNIETGDLGTIMENVDLGYPNYSRDDSKIIYDFPWVFGIDLGISTLNADKITSVSNSETVFLSSAKWGVWFSNGERELYVNTQEELLEATTLEIYPNPATTQIQILIPESLETKVVKVFNILGENVFSQKINKGETKVNVAVNALNSGVYTVQLLENNTITGKGRFIKE